MVYPSAFDLLAFMKDDKRKAEVIAARGNSSGKVYGYFILRKTKRTPFFDIHNQNTIKPVDEYGYESYRHKSIHDRQESLEKLARAYNLQFKFLGFDRKSRRNLAIVGAFIGLIGSILFLSSNLTGNVIGSSLSQTSTNWIGGALFVIGLIGAFVYFKRK